MLPMLEGQQGLHHHLWDYLSSQQQRHPVVVFSAAVEMHLKRRHLVSVVQHKQQQGNQVVWFKHLRWEI